MTPLGVIKLNNPEIRVDPTRTSDVGVDFHFDLGRRWPHPDRLTVSPGGFSIEAHATYPAIEHLDEHGSRPGVALVDDHGASTPEIDPADEGGDPDVR